MGTAVLAYLAELYYGQPTQGTYEDRKQQVVNSIRDFLDFWSVQHEEEPFLEPPHYDFGLDLYCFFLVLNSALQEGNFRRTRRNTVEGGLDGIDIFLGSYVYSRYSLNFSLRLRRFLGVPAYQFGDEGENYYITLWFSQSRFRLG